MNKVMSAVALFASLGIGSAGAQPSQPPPSEGAAGAVAAGAQVIVIEHDLTRTTGRVLSLDGRALSLALSDGQRREIPTATIGRLTERDGLRNGTLIGLGIGAGLGIVSGVLVQLICESESDGCLGAGIGLGLLGAGGGAALGAAFDAIWQPIVYLNEPVVNGRRLRMPSETFDELVVQVNRTSSRRRGGASTDLGLAWSHISRSGLGFEIQGRRSIARTFRFVECVREFWPPDVPHPCLGSGEEGEAPLYTASGKLHYYFPVSRVQPFVGGGIEFGTQEERFIYPLRDLDGTPQVFQQRAHDSFSSLVGEVGARVPLTRNLILRPAVTFQFGSYREAVSGSIGVGYVW